MSRDARYAEEVGTMRVVLVSLPSINLRVPA